MGRVGDGALEDVALSVARLAHQPVAAAQIAEFLPLGERRAGQVLHEEPLAALHEVQQVLLRLVADDALAVIAVVKDHVERLQRIGRVQRAEVFADLHVELAGGREDVACGDRGDLPRMGSNVIPRNEEHLNLRRLVGRRGTPRKDW